MLATRRSFIRNASLAATGSALGLRPFGALNAFAQSGVTGYKALVCIFLFGGNDANNMIVPFDTAGYSNYSGIRGPLALPQSSLLQLGPAPNFALNGNMAELASLFNSNALAVVANVGTLTQPTTRSQFLAGSDIPDHLFSHPDQQLEWQNAAQSTGTTTGWAGRISDLLGGTYNSNANIPMITSVAGDTLFCNGQSSTPLSIAPGSTGNALCYENGKECAEQLELAQSFLTLSSGVSLIQADNAITSSAYTYGKVLTSAVSSLSPLQTPFPAGNNLAAQLKQIAQIIQARTSFGVGRQIFFASLGNFDTHSNQVAQQGALLSELSGALSAFYQATAELGIANQVTTFTMSDFSRTFQPNSNTGSDHAWGSHHMVLGGAVQGGQMFGTYPTLALGGPDDSGSNGRWVPSTASVQYAATLARWFGLGASQMAAVFPTLGNFNNSLLSFV